ncbi:hypothetical protein GOD78_30535 [Sinorhizobium medicae]|nr:hypothetical protein [Sinorhizobium medicae]MDX0821705.1 hypothetical protein [Sinorhizobium medicae]MDX0864728.1 hypothetical protein [Sinorhizobium medicae]RVJ19027.1 hypothetical protein CN179_30085 [Sinorhizobium medicae]
MNTEFRGFHQVIEAENAGMPAIIASYVHALKFNDEPQGVGVIYGSVTGHFCLLRCSVFALIKTAGMQPGVESVFRNI